MLEETNPFQLNLSSHKLVNENKKLSFMEAFCVLSNSRGIKKWKGVQRILAAHLSFFYSSIVLTSTNIPITSVITTKNDISIKTMFLNSYQVLNPSEPGGA